MNKNRIGRNRRERVLYQEVAEEAVNTENTSNDKENEFGVLRSGTFGITVKGDDGKVLYENKEEPFEYQVCERLSQILAHSGAKLTEDQVDFIGKALTSEDAETDKSIGEALQNIVKIYNAKLKADAKSSRYQSLVNKYKPLEGEKLETAQAKTINNIVKMSGLPVESVIDMLKANKAIPADYTVEDYKATPLRRTKDDSED